MTDHDDPRPDASADLADDGGGGSGAAGSDVPRSDASGSVAAQPGTPPHELEHRVNYGRLVNVLAATTERLERKGHTVTEAQTRIILKRMRAEAPEGKEPEQAEYRLGALAAGVATVAHVDEAYVASVVRDVVEPRDD